jgi:nitroreductase
MIDAIVNRRSIRRYTDEPVSPADIEVLKEAAIRAPSSRNLKCWRFEFVTDREKLVDLSTAKERWGEFVAGAPLGVVICGDETTSDCWVEDCSIAATLLQITATDLGLGSCWIQIRERPHADGSPAEQYVRDVLGLPAELRVLCILAIGHPAEEKAPHRRDDLAWVRITDVG